MDTLNSTLQSFIKNEIENNINKNLAKENTLLQEQLTEIQDKLNSQQDCLEKLQAQKDPQKNKTEQNYEQQLTEQISKEQWEEYLLNQISELIIEKSQQQMHQMMQQYFEFNDLRLKHIEEQISYMVLKSSKKHHPPPPDRKRRQLSITNNPLIIENNYIAEEQAETFSKIKECEEQFSEFSEKLYNINQSFYMAKQQSQQTNLDIDYFENHIKGKQIMKYFTQKIQLSLIPSFEKFEKERGELISEIKIQKIEIQNKLLEIQNEYQQQNKSLEKRLNCIENDLENIQNSNQIFDIKNITNNFNLDDQFKLTIKESQDCQKIQQSMSFLQVQQLEKKYTNIEDQLAKIKVQMFDNAEKMSGLTHDIDIIWNNMNILQDYQNQPEKIECQLKFVSKIKQNSELQQLIQSSF